MSPKYRWVCHLCGATNSAGTSICGRCGFAAVASPVEVSAAQAALGIGLPPHASEQLPSEPSEPASLPVRVLEALLVAVMVLGALLGRFAGPVWLNFAGVALAGVALFSLWCVGWVRKGSQAHV